MAETISLPQVREDSRSLSVFYLPTGKQGILLLFLPLSMSLEFSTLVLVLACWECSSGTFVKGCQIRGTTQGEICQLLQLLQVVTELQKWPYMVATCRTFRLEEASWLDPGMEEHSCLENPLIHTKEPLTIPLGRWCSFLQPSLLYSEVRNRRCRGALHGQGWRSAAFTLKEVKKGNESSLWFNGPSLTGAWGDTLPDGHTCGFFILMIMFLASFLGS